MKGSAPADNLARSASLSASSQESIASGKVSSWKGGAVRELKSKSERASVASELADIQAFLLCPTPPSWLDKALDNPELLLIDHANCEKKAASTALNLIYRHTENFDLLNKMSRLAREELRHFEQVIAIMEKRGIAYRPLSAAGYAAALRKEVRTYEPARLIDTLIVGGIIEARSCERFAALAPHLDEELAGFYTSLLKSEARHFKDYLSLANAIAEKSESQGSQASLDQRIQELLAIEAKLIESPEESFRFHSGS